LAISITVLLEIYSTFSGCVAGYLKLTPRTNQMLELA